ncbi:MAG: glycoside hydrolase [Clostridia bacterium]|nr:glycoside hydrolase [Clostridia bacterium]
MSVYKIRYGTPEEVVPSRFAPAPACDILTEQPAAAADMRFSTSPRGVKITMPIDPAACIYGFGLQLKGFQHRGTKKHIRPNADPVSNSGDTHAPVPFFVTTAGFGLYVDTARYATFYCGKELRPEKGQEDGTDANRLVSAFEDIYAIREGSDRTILTIEIPIAQGVDLYYITGETILSIVSQYNLLSGGGCMPPMWGLGCFYRCDMKFNEEQVLAMAHRIRELCIPCDILGLEPGWQSHTYSCSYVWDEGRFANAASTVKEICDAGFHLNLWEHAFTHPTAPIYDALIPYSGDYLVWNGLVPDFTLPEARKIFADHQRTLVEMGVSGFKLDECDGSDFTGGWTFPNCALFPSGMDGEQYHSLFGTLYAQTISEALGNRRTLSEVRNLGSLAASYPFVLYSDLYGHKDFITGVVNAGFSGLLWSPEVRHAENAEDLIRRVQSVVFSPQALVNAFYLSEMPWEMHGCTDEIRELFRVRMSLIPYLFTMFYDYHTQGKPPVRALVCDYEKEAEARECKDEYLFGDAMVVAPLTAPEKERDVWLPQGEWFDFFTGKRYEGGKHHIVTDGIPVFVKGGTLLPVAAPVEYVKPDTCFAITLRAYGDCKNAVCRLVEDSDETTDATYRVIELTEQAHETSSARYRVIGVEEMK